MAGHAVADNALFDVSDIEAARPGASYTLDTARALKVLDGNPVHWLIGADMLLTLPNWHQPLDLLREVTFVIMARPGWSLDWDSLPAEYRHLAKNVVTTPLISITASDIRARVAAGRSIRYLTPDPVCQYIEQHALYR
jgi:nicotinate-nucleotide adenylyltransferase